MVITLIVSIIIVVIIIAGSAMVTDKAYKVEHKLDKVDDIPDFVKEFEKKKSNNNN